MEFLNKNLSEFTQMLASGEPVPGGGGACALVGALAASLGGMVGNLTAGKPKYAAVEADIRALTEKADAFRKELLTLVERDAEAFLPLSRAYALPKETETQRAEKAEAMERALREACTVPMEIMETCGRVAELLREFAEKGSALAISDAGVGALFSKAALIGASLNVLINTKAMADRDYASSLEARADMLLSKYCALADEVYEIVLKRIR